MYRQGVSGGASFCRESLGSSRYMVKLSNNDWMQINSIIAKINREKDDQKLREEFLKDFKELVNYDFGVFDLTLLKDGNFTNLSFSIPRLVN